MELFDDDGATVGYFDDVLTAQFLQTALTYHAGLSEDVAKFKKVNGVLPEWSKYGRKEKELVARATAIRKDK